MSAFDNLLKHSVTIQRTTLGTEDAYGHGAQTVTDVATVAALVQPKGTRMGGGQVEEVNTQGVGTQINDFTVFMRIPSTVPSATDKLYVAAGGVHTGKTFEIRQVREAGGQYHHLEIDCRLIDSGTT
ncbi:MAG TPA: head-tail adaptor protein [Gemmatimonadales bacterium]|nr:head-tail adaptor protein [Gemmatimonadales bacterium]